MSVPTTDLHTTAPSSSLRSRIESAPVWRVGLVAGIAGAFAAELFAQLAHALGATLEVGSNASNMEPIPFGGFAIVTAMWAVVGTVFAMALARWAKHPARPFVITTVALTVLSFAFPITTTASGMTKFLLCIAHVVAAAVIIPPLAVRLARPRPAHRALSTAH